MRTLALLLAVVPAAAALPAAAQPATTGAPGQTMLHLSATGTVHSAPDVLVADMIALNVAPGAAAAQRAVNAMIAAGLQAAQAAHIEARALDYAVGPADDKNRGWSAQQTLTLQGGDAPRLLDLVGTLQQRGFATASLAWQLSPALRQQAMDEATKAALTALQARAAAAAAVLGLHVDHMSDVRLDDAGLAPRIPMMMAAVRSAPPPQATAAPEAVSETASADIVLRP